jgi:hypothetical protein
MSNKEGHRRFGNVRKLPSGRYQVRYPGPDGRLRSHRKPSAARAMPSGHCRSSKRRSSAVNGPTRNAARSGSATTPATGSHSARACA